MKNKILVLSIIIISLCIVIFLWYYNQRIEKQYQACLDKCRAEHGGIFANIGFPDKQAESEACRASCREKYAK